MSYSSYKKNLKGILFYIKTNKLSDEEVYEILDTRNKNKLVPAFLDLLDNEIDHFSYDDNRDLTYLFTLLDVLPRIIENNKYLKRTTISSFKDIHREIKEKIHSRPVDMTKMEQSKYRILKNLLSKMEDTTLKFYSKIPADYDASKEEYISYVLFNSKNLAFFELALKKFPYMVNSRNKEEVSLVDRVLDKYLESLDKYLDYINLGPIDDLFYYNKVFKTIMKNPKLSINDEDKKRMLTKVKQYVCDKNYDSNRINEKLTYFTNNLLFIIMNEDEELDEVNLNYEYEVHDKFKAANLSEAKKIYILNKDLTPSNCKRRIYTFDGPNSYELDDGVSIVKQDGIYKLGVHIANPAYYIPKNSIIMTEAERRTRSLYFGDKCIPMLPSNLSSDLMSLNTNGVKNVISFYFDIDELSGELIDFKIKKENVKIYENKTYSNFNDDLVKTNNSEYYDTLVNLCNVSDLLKRHYNETEDYKSLHRNDDSSLSTSVIASIMIFTNIQIAKYFSDRGLPYIYRCHKIDEKDIKEIEELKERVLLDSENEIATYLEQLKNIYPKAYYTTQNVGHVGLGVDFYSHSTSPLRRFTDIANLDSINRFVISNKAFNNDDINIYSDTLYQIANDVNSKRSTLDDYEIEAAKKLNKSL